MAGGRVSRVGIGAVLLGASFGYSAGVVGPAAAPVAAHFDVSLGASGLMTSVYFVAIAVFALVGAAVEDRIGIAWSARIAAVLMGAGGLLAAVAPWFSVLLIGRAFAGLGTGMALIAGPVIVRALKSTLLLGIYGGGITLGLAAALFAGGELAEAGVSWRVNFAISAAVGVVALPLLLRGVPAVEAMRRVGARGVWSLLRRWPFWRADLLFVFVNGIPIIVGAWLIPYLTRHHGLGAGVGGAFGFLLFGVTTVTRPAFGKLSDRPDLRVVLAVLGPVLGAAGLVALALDRTAAVAAVAIVLLGVAFGAPYAIAYQRIEDVIEGNPELGLALGFQGVNVAAIAVVPLIGAALEHGYGRLSFLLLAGYCVLAGLVNARRGD